MTNKKNLIAPLILIAVVMILGFYLWKRSVFDIQSRISEISQPQESAEVTAPKSTTDNETKKQEINADTAWKTHTSEEGGISFEYPQHFFLLDRSKDDKRIYISSREISFNDFANGYFEPIEIIFKDESKNNNMINTLENKNVSQGTVSGKNALVISGVVSENPPSYGSYVFAIFFPEQNISIIANNRFNIDNNFDLEIVVRKIAATLVIE